MSITLTVALLSVTSANAAEIDESRATMRSLRLSFDGDDSAEIVFQGDSEPARGLRESGRRVAGERHARAPVMPDRWPSYEPLYPMLFEAAGRTRAAVHGFEVW